MIAVLRLSYKPLDISYFSDYHSLYINKVPELSNLKSEKAYLKLNVLKNELIIKIDNVFLKNLNSNILNVKAKEAYITFRLTAIIKNKIQAENITIIKGGLDIYDVKKFSLDNQFKKSKDKYAFNSIIFEKINVNVYKNNKKVVMLTNCNLALAKSKDGIHINNLLIDNIVLKDFNNENKFILNDLKWLSMQLKESMFNR